LAEFRSWVAAQQLQGNAPTSASGTSLSAFAIKTNTDADTSSTVKNRCGTLVPVPSNVAPTNPTLTTYPGTAYYSEVSGCTSGTTQPTSLVSLPIAQAAYYFVNEFQYGPYEPGCHNDQVWGWYTNVNTGELQLFTTTEGVVTQATRLCLSSLLDTSVTSSEKKQLKVLNKLYKLSKSAVKEINGIPSQEGNIVEVCDCKGDRWLLYINGVNAQNGSPLSTCNYQFTIIATKLC
jgi:hypothetical protein